MLYGINGNVHVVGGPIVARHCMLAEWCYMVLTACTCSWWTDSSPTFYDGLMVLYGINGNVHVVGGPIVAWYCMLAEWCYMVLCSWWADSGPTLYAG